MSVFVISLCVGLGGLLLMALPGVRRHGRAGHARAARGRAGPRHAGRAMHAGRGVHAVRGGRAVRGHSGRAAPRAHGARNAPAQPAGAHAHQVPRQPTEGVSAIDGVMHYLPEPRVVLTVIALFGAFGNVLAHLTHLSFVFQLAGAVLLAALLEWLLVGRIWKLALQFTGEPSSPLEMLLLSEVKAVTPFKNGKGIVQAERDGRATQLTAELLPEERGKRVRVGDQLTIEEVDVEHERVRVSTL